jgi:O-antigen/teichoic acid export membrane protein
MQKTYLKYAVPLGAASALVALLICGWVFRTFMSAAFAASANVYRILILSTLFNTVFVPLPEALMNFIAPKQVTICTALGLAWVGIGGFILIPLYGAIGAAILMLTARILVGTLLMTCAHRLAKTKQGQIPTPPVNSAYAALDLNREL